MKDVFNISRSLNVQNNDRKYEFLTRITGKFMKKSAILFFHFFEKGQIITIFLNTDLDSSRSQDSENVSSESGQFF